MARRDRRKAEEPGVPGWIVTYGDMMSLLLCFFVLLLSFSIIDERKFTKAVVSLRGAFGVLPKLTSVVGEQTKPRKRAPEEMHRLARKLRRKMQVAGREGDVKIEFDKEGGLKIVLPNQVLFDTARAELRPNSYGVLQSVAELLSELQDCFIEVRGHTDSRPLVSSAKYRDNYDLSYGRADAVARRVHVTGRIPLNQFEIVACGPGQPVATNQTEDGQQANRRVEIYVRGALQHAKMGELGRRMEEETSVGHELDPFPAPTIVR